MNNRNNDWLTEYQDFIRAENSVVPEVVTTKLFSKMSTLLRPSAWVVFLKILIIHMITGGLSLSICHQFGLNPFGTKYSLADWFMSVGGHHFCMLGCGILFVGTGILAAGYFLSVEEMIVLKRTKLLQNLSLGIISLGLFTAFGAEIILSIAAIWLLGGLIGGYLATTTVSKFKFIEIAR